METVIRSLILKMGNNCKEKLLYIFENWIIWW
jgi:hypothetical protein